MDAQKIAVDAAVAVGQRDHGVDGDFLGIHGFPHAVGSPSRLSVGVAD